MFLFSLATSHPCRCEKVAGEAKASENQEETWHKDAIGGLDEDVVCARGFRSYIASDCVLAFTPHSSLMFVLSLVTHLTAKGISILPRWLSPVRSGNILL